MHRVRSTVAASGLVLLAATVAAQAQTAPQLADYSQEQRWERAALHVPYFMGAMISQARQEGGTVRDVARHVYEIQGGWGVESPAAMVTAMHRNLMMFPGAEFEIMSETGDAITVRRNRPYATAFGENGEMFGVTVEDIDDMLRHFHMLVAQAGGLAFSETRDGDHVTITISEQADAAAAVEGAVGSFFDAMEDWDYTALRSTVTSDFELVEDTVIMNMDEFVSYIGPFEAQDARMRWELSDFNTEIADDVAWTRYVNRAVLHMQGEESRFHWIESAVLRRQPDGRWRIDRLQSTPVSIEGAMAGH